MNYLKKCWAEAYFDRENSTDEGSNQFLKLVIITKMANQELLFTGGIWSRWEIRTRKCYGIASHSKQRVVMAKTKKNQTFVRKIYSSNFP